MTETDLPAYVDSHLEPIGHCLFAEDIPALERALASGWDINQPVRLNRTVSEYPVTIALNHRKGKVLDLLLRNGVELNLQPHPPLFSAIECGSVAILEKLVAHGMQLDIRNPRGIGAYAVAVSAKRFDLLPALLQLGLPVDADGGDALRVAALYGHLDAVKFFVEQGLDVNLRKRDSAFPYNPSTIAVAARNGDFAMVRYLVEHGADITLRDAYGNRPYSLAAGHEELQQYLQSLEPPAWHDADSCLEALRPYELPAGLVRLLCGSKRRMDLEGCVAAYIEFHNVTEVKEIEWGGRRILDLLADVDDHSEIGFLGWSPHDAKLVHVDFEHDEFKLLCAWEEFEQDPAKWINSSVG